MHHSGVVHCQVRNVDVEVVAGRSKLVGTHLEVSINWVWVLLYSMFTNAVLSQAGAHGLQWQSRWAWNRIIFP